MTEVRKMAALFEVIVDGRLSRRQALQRASALGLGMAAATTLPGRLGGLMGEAVAQEGGEIIVGASQEAVNFNPLLYTNTGPDRKSTRLNSSHGYISYAVFCLKKKKKTKQTTQVQKKNKPHIRSLKTDDKRHNTNGKDHDSSLRP